MTGTLTNNLNISNGVEARIGATAGHTLTWSATAPNLIFSTLHFGSATDTGTVNFQAAPLSSTSGSGTVAVDGGKLIFGNSYAATTLGVGSANFVVGTGATQATLDINGNYANLNNLSGNANGIITNNGASSQFLAENTVDTTFAGVIQDGSGKTGIVAGSNNGSTLTLSGVNTYTGVTSIAGTLALSGAGSIRQFLQSRDLQRRNLRHFQDDVRRLDHDAVGHGLPR